MAKKSRRVRKAALSTPPVPPIARPPAERPQVIGQPSIPTPTTGLKPGSSRPAGGGKPAAGSRPADVRTRVVDFSEEYKYVVGDLKRIGVLAGLIFSALIVLSFILR